LIIAVCGLHIHESVLGHQRWQPPCHKSRNPTLGSFNERAVRPSCPPCFFCDIRGVLVATVIEVCSWRGRVCWLTDRYTTVND
jgi:hypothetical protein